MIRRFTMAVRGVRHPLKLILASVSMMTIVSVLGLPPRAWADPLLYIVTQNNITTTNPIYDTNDLVSVNLSAHLVSGEFTATTIGPTYFAPSSPSSIFTPIPGQTTAEIRGLAYD